MNWKSTWLLLALAAVLFAFIVLVERHMSPTSATAQPPARLLSFQTAAVTNITVRRTNQFILRVEKTNGTWNLTGPLFYPAQTYSIEGLLQMLQNLTSPTHIPPEELRATRRSLAEYGLDLPSATLTLQHDGQRTEIFFGARTTLGDSIYAQVDNQPGIYVLNADVYDRLPRGANDWRSTALFTELSFDHFEVRAPGRGFAMAINPTNQTFYLSKPTPARADNAKVTALLLKVVNARALQFVTDDPRAELEVFGLQPPEAELVLGLGTNDVVTIQFGKSPTNDPTLVYARRLSQTNIVLVSKAVLETLQTSYTELRDRRLMSFTPAVVTEIACLGPEKFSVRRETNDSWIVVGPPNAPADSGLVREWLDRLGQLTGNVEKDVVTDFAGYGLAPPLRQFLVKTTLTNAAGLATNAVIARLDIGVRQGEKIFARQPDENSVYVITPADYDGLPAAAWQLRDRRIWSFTTNQVSRVSIRQRGYTRTLIRDISGEWRLAPGSQGIINPFAVEEALHNLGELRVAVWVARGDENRAAYGFTPGGHQLTIELRGGDKPRVLIVEFGGRAPSQYPYALVTAEGQSWIVEFPLKLFFDVIRDLGNPAPRSTAGGP